MGIDFSKFSQEIQSKIKAALEDTKSPDKIDAAELRAMNLEKDIANKLMQELCGNRDYLGDGYIKMQNENKTLILLDKPENNSFIPLTKDSLDYYHKQYYGLDIAQGVYKDGMIYLADSKGKLVKDKFNNYICERVSVQEYEKEEDNISGNFEIIENEPAERTNRRFAVAFIRSMYAEVIGELQTIVSQMGVLDVGMWREALGMGVQAIADLKENQQLITASTKKKIERIEAERDNICNSLNDLIDSPAEFESKFYQLVGKDYRDNAFDELRDIQHNQENKDSKTKFKECVAKFKELYPENNISGNIEDWEDSVEYQKMADEIANIVVMFIMTGGLGKLFNGSVQALAKEILLAAAKGNKKTVIANFAKLAPEVQTLWKSLARGELGVATAQVVTPMAQSAATMSSWEGIKAFLNNLTNAEEMSPEELLKRTLEGIESGAEMGVIMGGLEVVAIAPVMTKMTPVLNKLSGASAEISGLIEKGNGVVSMEKVMATYSKASEALRGKIIKEGAHTLVALPTLTAGFTVTDTAFHFDEAEFRKQLLEAATTDEERNAIMKMNSVDLRLEFAKADFINQVKGMATIEGVGLMFRRLQAGRLAGKTFNQHQRDIIGANLREVKENGKTYYELCTSEGKVLTMKDGNDTISRFSSMEKATAAYSALCLTLYNEIMDLGSGDRLEKKYNEPQTAYEKIGNDIFEVVPRDLTENLTKIEKIKAKIEYLRKTDIQKANELQIVLEMFTNPTSVHNVTDTQIDAVVNYLNSHYDSVKNYLTEQAGEIGISDKNIGRFGHRIKGEWSTRDKIANYIKDSIKKEKECREKGQAYTPRTLLDAYQDVRDKYACRTVFDNVNYANHPEIVKILEEGNYSDAAYRKAQLRAAELQSEPAVDMLKEAMRKAVKEGKDLSMMRISNYTSEGGIPILSEAQLAELKECGIELGIDVSFIRLASEEELNTTKMIVKGATTKAQPSGYTALQINFVTKAGEIIEWQYRGELVNKFAEAEHLPYDIRTGKHPWRQYPELETLYKPIADLLAEKNMPKYAYDQLNHYFTDYYNHLRKLELGFESKEPRLEDYEHWKAKEKDGVEREYTFKFDKRLSAKNLETLHFYGEGIKDGTIKPERALEEYNAEVGYKEVKTDADNPIKTAQPLSGEGLIKELKEMGLSDSDISRINFDHPMIASGIELFRTMREYNPEKFGHFSSNLLVNICNHLGDVFNEDSPFIHYTTRNNVKALLEVAEFDGSPLDDMHFWQDTDVSELYRMAKHYFDVTGEKLPIELISKSNREFKTEFPTNEQIDVALRMEKSGLWTKYAMLGHSMVVESPEKVTDKFIETIKELKEKAKTQGADLSIEYNLNNENIELVNRIKEYNDKSPIDFRKIITIQNNNYLHPHQVLFYLEVQEKGIDMPEKYLASLIREIDSMFSSVSHAKDRKEMAMFLTDNLDIYNQNPQYCGYTVRYADKYNVELAKQLLLDKDFSKEEVYHIQESISIKGNLPNYKATDEEVVKFYENKAKFAQILCLDKSLNLPADVIQKLVANYYDGCEETVINGIKSGLITKHPMLKDYPADCWENILKRNLTDRAIKQATRNFWYDPTIEYARAKDDNIANKHFQLKRDALANKDLLKSGLEDITDGQITSIVSQMYGIHTIDLIGLGNTEAAFPLMLEEFGEFLKETSELSERKLSEGNKEFLLTRVNPVNTQRAKKLNEEITALKKQINKAVGEENLAKIKEFQGEKSKIDEQIKRLKQSENSETPEVKQQIKELQKQSKALNGQAQSIYYSCENASEVRELMQKLSPKQKELKEFLAENSGIEPQEVVTKIRVLSALSEISTEDEMANFIQMIKPSNPENNAAWNEAVNKKIFQKLGVEYDETLSQKLDLIHCKYISKMFISNEDFFDNMRTLVDVIKANPELSVEEAINNMPQNIETKRIFEELGFDFDKFIKVDKDSFTSVKVKLSAEEAKQASIHNLEEDLNDALFQSLPKKETEPIFERLREELGVTFEKSQKDNWEGDGFSAGTTEYYRLYKDGRPIVFEDMNKIITLIKREINKNNFWTRTQGDEQLDNARKTMYTHLIKMRTQEVDNALEIKDGDVAEIEVRKTDMYDIKKALGLGNDAQCCTALGRNMNEWSAPTYIMNKCIGAIELTDKGSFVGNTMIYLAYVDGKPALVLDNIELKTKYQNNDKIRDTFMEYAKKLCAEIGQPDLPIYAGPNRHKLNMDIYPKVQHTMEIIGNSGEQEVYADYDAGSHVIGQGEKAEIEMYRIR